MESLGSAAGTLAFAIAALLLVMGLRFARPARAREWIAFAAYSGSLAVTLAADLGVAWGRAADPGLAVRAAGGAVLLAGLLLAGSASRARQVEASGGPAAPPSRWRVRHGVEAGLALVLAGQLLRAPSRAGAAASGIAALALAWVAARRGER